MVKKTFSAGGVVVNRAGEVVVVNQDGMTWSLPKGHIDLGETTRQAAEREIREESGVHQLTYIRDLGSYERYRIGIAAMDDVSELKHITMFLYFTEQEDFAPEDKRHQEVRWVKAADVVSLLTHPKDKAFFKQLLQKKMLQWP